MPLTLIGMPFRPSSTAPPTSRAFVLDPSIPQSAVLIPKRGSGHPIKQMYPTVYRDINFAWLAFVIVWLAGALTAKRAVRREGAASRLLHALLPAVAAALVFMARRPGGSLAWRVVGRSGVAADAGLALTVAGVALAIWARVILGGNWSGTVTIKEDHKLVRSGPYRLVRKRGGVNGHGDRLWRGPRAHRSLNRPAGVVAESPRRRKVSGRTVRRAIRGVPARREGADPVSSVSAEATRPGRPSP
jgi:hypothetical protein